MRVTCACFEVRSRAMAQFFSCPLGAWSLHHAGKPALLSLFTSIGISCCGRWNPLSIDTVSVQPPHTELTAWSHEDINELVPPCSHHAWSLAQPSSCLCDRDLELHTRKSLTLDKNIDKYTTMNSGRTFYAHSDLWHGVVRCL